MTSPSQTSIEAADVVRIVLQFLRENLLTRTVAALQEEAQVALNAVDNVEAFTAEVMQGKWENVMPMVKTLKLPLALLAELHEQLVLELVELRELDMARQLLQSSQPLVNLQAISGERFLKLEGLAAKPYFDARDAYRGGGDKLHRRGRVAERLRSHVSSVPPSRLLALLGQALKWQQHQGQLPVGKRFNLFVGSPTDSTIEPESYVTSPGPTIKFGQKSHAECSAFSPDGQYLVSGSVDGFLEVWDFERGRLRLDLAYQAEDDLMMHERPVLAVSFSRDSELLASGSQEGDVKIWRVQSGQCIRRFSKAHAQGVTCLAFSIDGSLIASGSFDAVARLHGLKSGKMLKELRGHTSYVNAIVYAPDGVRIVSGSSDGSVRVWDVKTSACTSQFNAPSHLTCGELSINGLAFLPTDLDKLVVCNRSPHIFIMGLDGQLIKTLSSGKRDGGDFVACAVSAEGHWIHAIAEDGQLYCFNVSEGKLRHLLQAHEKHKMAIGVAVHPHRNLVATWADEGKLKLWR